MIPPKKILVIEDNEINREILSEILSETYQVLEAENGREGLEILKKYKESISLILLDVMMPVMDGFAFLEEVQKEEELALVPVIVMTQKDSEEDEVRALSHGATDFVPKPYRPQVLLHRVASIIKLRENASIVNQFQYDRLTGVYSKEFFYRRVRDCLLENPDTEYNIVCSNVENFKLYNDAFGTKEGDLLLKKIARFIIDGMGNTVLCGRLGADRFIWVQERRLEVDNKLIANMTEIVNEKNVVMKWGVYEVTDRTLPVEQMCDRAQLAADSIKGQYNCHFAVYDDRLRTKLLREKAITDAMETALVEKQFIVYLQPKYSLNDDCMAGAEALVRWIHPEWGFMSPGEFIPLFEKNGFIPRLDQYVWEEVCAKMQEWKEKGYPLIPVSVNVSRADVFKSDLVEKLLDITERYGVEPAYLHLEITESAYAENPNQIIATVEKLKDLGFIIEMDDFGSGYSSLNMLNQMKLDILKLDMKFIQNEMEKSEEHSILRFIVRLAHWMNLRVVAEGVETKEQVERLREMGCDYVQGYYFAKPMPTVEFEELLKTMLSCPLDYVYQHQDEEHGMKSILLADENAAYREMVSGNLKEQYQVLEASDADRALEILNAGAKNGISAVILSMSLPGKGAESLMGFLHKNPAFWNIPVLAMVPRGEVMDEYPMAQDADDFICKCHPQKDLMRRVTRLVEISAAREREHTLQDEANRDYLTGLLNRRGLQTTIDSLSREDLPFALYLFDLDNLKAINDEFGHEEGDRHIQDFANLVRRHTRSEDIQCRYGGDEFVLILKHLADEESVLKKGEKICKCFRDYHRDRTIPYSCSAGVVLCTADMKPSARLIEFADQALYNAKREKKGSCCIWSDTV